MSLQVVEWAAAWPMVLPYFDGSVPAGFPSPAEDYLETPLDLHDFLIDNKAATFLMRVDGDSMRDAGILDGDLLVVDRAVKPDNGCVVVVAVNGEYTVRDIIERENVTVFSSNHALYCSLSAKVSSVLLSMVPTIENYSIDESFLNLGEFREREVEPLARELRERVQRWVGIPTCVGIAPTKTLAKVANFIAKKRPQYRGVCDLRSSQVRADLLSTVPVDEVWGIGAASAARLARIGVQTAADLAELDPDNARALMTVTGGRTVYELRGISCLPLELMEPTRKGIAVTRSFGAPVTSWQQMREAIASYSTRAAEKMRRYKVAAEKIFVFMHTNTFNNDPFYSNGASARFSETTNDTGEVVALAVRLGERLWRDGFRYSKCGVMITELLPETIRQPALWGELDREKRERAWRAMDKLNATLGRDTVRILGAGPKDAAWKLRAEHRSPRWTTRWDELSKASAK